MKFLTRRGGGSHREHQPAAQPTSSRADEYRARVETERAALIERLTMRYYAHSAIVTHNRVTNVPGDYGFLTGACSGLVEALADVTGKDILTIGFRLEHGIPVTERWVATNDAPHGCEPDIRLLHDGVRESATERLDMLHRTALRASGHPMYSFIYASVNA